MMNSDLKLIFIAALICVRVASEWTQIGGVIDGEAADDFFGKSVAMSADGSVVAIGAYGNDPNGNNNAGNVRVYRYIDGDWIQVGSDIDGDAAYLYSG